MMYNNVMISGTKGKERKKERSMENGDRHALEKEKKLWSLLNKSKEAQIIYLLM